jgi:hypothetical protein
MVALGAVLYAVGGATENRDMQPLALALIPAAIVRAFVQAAGYLRSGVSVFGGVMDSVLLVGLTLAFAQLFERLGWGTQ